MTFSVPIKRALQDFRQVETWVFDLDNTLYPPHSDLWPKIDARITAYMAALLGLDGMSARALQKHYYRVFGTTLSGLIHEYQVDPTEFLRFVHDIDRSSLDPNPALAAAIEALPGRKLILTNGSHAHALATAKQLGIDHLFDDCFAIEHGDFLPKPHLLTYQRFFERHAVDPARAAMFEDIVHNLEAPHASGMLTVLVKPKHGAEDFREAWEKHEGVPAHVDFATDDLVGFLAKIVS
ncbi:pyrimidine 5'-nucleotidase [Rhodoblastus sphagnicola]|uniref:Pyrimidine 5'-nucleotidase n=1 Tax=Rhodoblastus sphagnicola TaxID=333368 RepID=A0A2S6NBP5_9HYPH|nr:pyrimidine 5'-nucleotidase [Rhodoblastus sphagnicola]MBB4199701.1 putative hydrolase of the HAD superfamily [Rhodoblastus sphagnicola]PPQ32038.1 pyrimidine 5'-nucleotidase [Rhodoblastus sphagnicola]